MEATGSTWQKPESRGEPDQWTALWKLWLRKHAIGPFNTEAFNYAQISWLRRACVRLSYGAAASDRTDKHWSDGKRKSASDWLPYLPFHEKILLFILVSAGFVFTPYHICLSLKKILLLLVTSIDRPIFPRPYSTRPLILNPRNMFYKNRTLLLMCQNHFSLSWALIWKNQTICHKVVKLLCCSNRR
jgi:hypothetical protein